MPMDSLKKNMDPRDAYGFPERIFPERMIWTLGIPVDQGLIREQGSRAFSDLIDIAWSVCSPGFSFWNSWGPYYLFLNGFHRNS